MYHIVGDIDICNLLIDNDARLDCIDLRGCTPLHWAVEYGHVDLARLLLKRPELDILDLST